MKSSVFHYCVQPYLLRQWVSLTWNSPFLLVWLDSKLLESASLPSKAGILDPNAVCLLHRCWRIKYKSTFYLTISPVSNASLIEYSEYVKLRQVKGVTKAGVINHFYPEDRCHQRLVSLSRRKTWQMEIYSVKALQSDSSFKVGQ